MKFSEFLIFFPLMEKVGALGGDSLSTSMFVVLTMRLALRCVSEMTS